MDYLHVLNYEVEMVITTPPPVTLGYIDIAKDLSQQIGRNINQGEVFHLVGYDTSIIGTPFTNDFGLIAAGDLCYAEPTKNRVAAYKRQWEQWVHDRVTGPVRGEAGEQMMVYYDEVMAPTAYGSLTDFGERVGMYGGTVDGTYKGIFDEYEEAFPGRPEPTENNIETKLWTTRTDLLGEQCLPWHAGSTGTTSRDPITGVDPVVVGGLRTAHNAYEYRQNWCPAGQCWPIMLGLMKWNHTLIAPLNATQPGADSDSVDLRLTLYLTGWRQLR